MIEGTPALDTRCLACDRPSVSEVEVATLLFAGLCAQHLAARKGRPCGTVAFRGGDITARGLAFAAVSLSVPMMR